MEKKDFAVIWGVAHSDNVAGKQSPDGKHREPIWSKHQCELLDHEARLLGFHSYMIQPLADDLGGRVGFVRTCEHIASGYKRTIVIPLHNNAAGMGLWMEAEGFCIYTSRGWTNSDRFAEDLWKRLVKNIPEVKARYQDIGKKSFEENFTTLMGWNYNAVLLEWLFQDDVHDLKLIEDETICGKLRGTLIEWITYWSQND